MAKITTPLMFHSNKTNRAVFNRLRKNNFVKDENGIVTPLRSFEGLPEDVWKSVDGTIKDVIRHSLPFANTLRNYGMVNTNNSLGKLLKEWWTQSDVDEDANIDMMGDAETDNEEITYGINAIPMPIVYTDFRIPWRMGMTMNEPGIPSPDFDSGMVSGKTRKVAEAIEDMMLNGSDVTLNGYSPSGATNHNDIYTGSLTDDWADASEIEHVIGDVLDIRQEQIDDGFPENGPFVLFINSRFASIFEEDYKSYSERTLKQRVLSITGIDNIVVVPDLPDENDDGVSTNYVMLMYMSSETMQIEQAADIQAVEWESEGGFTEHYRVFTCQAPRVISDFNGKVGISYYND